MNTGFVCLYADRIEYGAIINGLPLPEAIFVLSGGIKEVITRIGHRRYRSTAFSDFDPRGLLGGGKSRVIATVELAHNFPQTYLVTTSRVEPDFPSHASVMADELGRYGISSERIIIEEESTSTISELVEMVLLANKWKWNSVWLVTNEYHIPRVQEMYVRLTSLIAPDNEVFHTGLSVFHARNAVVCLVAAEQMLARRSPHYVHLIKRVKQTEAYEGRLVAEARGLKHLQEGRYSH